MQKLINQLLSRSVTLSFQVSTGLLVILVLSAIASARAGYDGVMAGSLFAMLALLVWKYAPDEMDGEKGDEPMK